MTLSSGGRRLKQWLVEQINSNQYNGLQWEDDHCTMFRIPWKHAGKQDYNQEVDASIFKAWAIFKGKFKDGDKAEPATWKTRLRCALNKSPDFEEVTERSQLDISEPYKVYRIVPEEEQKSKSTSPTTNINSTDMASLECSPAEFEELIKDVNQSSSDEYTMGLIKRSHSPPENTLEILPTQDWWPHDSPGAMNVTLDINHSISADDEIVHRRNALEMQDLANMHSILGLSVKDRSKTSNFYISPIHSPPVMPLPSKHEYALTQMKVSFFYGGIPMGCVITTHPEGCRISPCPPPASSLICTGSGADSLQLVRFPSVELIESERQRQVTRKLFGHLERGVLLRCNREGIFIKRLCQSRVFYSLHSLPFNPYGVYSSCKLDRDSVNKIFDMASFLQSLQLYQEGSYPAPDPTVTLCFGEEFNDLNTAKNKLIIVQITAVACQHLMEEVCSYNFGAPQSLPCFPGNLAITA